MPTYIFRCESCDEEFDVQTSFSKKREVVRRSCGGSSLKELFGRYRTYSLDRAVAMGAVPAPRALVQPFSRFQTRAGGPRKSR